MTASLPALAAARLRAALQSMQAWWRGLPAARQDRLAFIAPLLAIVLFFALIVSAFFYLRQEDLRRDRETLVRDVSYAQQALRLRLLEQQEQLGRMGTEIARGALTNRDDITAEAEGLITPFLEIHSLSWMSPSGYLQSAYSRPWIKPEAQRKSGESVPSPQALGLTENTRDELQSVYYHYLPPTSPTVERPPALQLYVPVASAGRLVGYLLAEYSYDDLLRFGLPSDLKTKSNLSLRDAGQGWLAGISEDKLQDADSNTDRASLVPRMLQSLGLLSAGARYQLPIAPTGSLLYLQGQAPQERLGLVGNALFWAVCALSVITAWLLTIAWRHSRRRLRAQRELERETNFRRAMENSMLTGMRALDMQGRVIYVNQAFCAMTQWSESEMVGSSAPFPYWHPEDAPYLRQLLEDELAGRSSPGGVEMRILRKDGSAFDARLYVSPLRDAGDAGGAQTGWMTSVTDITEPKRIREELSSAYQRFTTVLEGLDAAVSVCPIGSQELLFANRFYKQWFVEKPLIGNVADASERAKSPARLADAVKKIAAEHSAVAHHELLRLAAVAAQNLGAEQNLLPADPNRVSANASSRFATGAGLDSAASEAALSQAYECFWAERGVWLDIRTRYLNWVDGRLAQMVIATDVSERHRMQEEAAQQAERAQTASRLISMGEMASSVAHELNQPLTAINNYCNGLLERLRSQKLKPEDLEAALQKTAKQAQRAGQIIERIRAFVRRSEPVRRACSVVELVTEALELAEIELRRRSIALEQHISPTLPTLMVEPILIEQVLINLLKNAAEASDMAGVFGRRRRIELHIAPFVLQGMSGVAFSVIDFGKGLSDEVKAKLFEPFFSTKVSGMGMGLNLCRTIVESHQGRLHAVNLYNQRVENAFSTVEPLDHAAASEVQGCCFTFWLPQS